MQTKTNLSHKRIAFIYGVSRSWISKICNQWNPKWGFSGRSLSNLDFPEDYFERERPDSYYVNDLPRISVLCDGKDYVCESFRKSSALNRAQQSSKVKKSALRQIAWSSTTGLVWTYTPMVLGCPTKNSNVKMHGQFDNDEERLVPFDRNHWNAEYDYLMDNGGIVRLDGEDSVPRNIDLDVNENNSEHSIDDEICIELTQEDDMSTGLEGIGDGLGVSMNQAVLEEMDLAFIGDTEVTERLDGIVEERATDALAEVANAQLMTLDLDLSDAEDSFSALFDTIEVTQDDILGQNDDYPTELQEMYQNDGDMEEDPMQGSIDLELAAQLLSDEANKINTKRIKPLAKTNAIDLDVLHKKPKAFLNGGPDCNGRTKLRQLQLHEKLHVMYEQEILKKCLLSMYLLLTREWRREKIQHIQDWYDKKRDDAPIFYRRLAKLGEGNQVLADCGFVMDSLLYPFLNFVVTPIPLGRRDQKSTEESERDRKVCELRYTCEVVFSRVVQEEVLNGVILFEKLPMIDDASAWAYDAANLMNPLKMPGKKSGIDLSYFDKFILN